MSVEGDCAYHSIMVLQIQLEIVDGTISELCPGLKETKRRCLFSLHDIGLFQVESQSSDRA